MVAHAESCAAIRQLAADCLPHEVSERDIYDLLNRLFLVRMGEFNEGEIVSKVSSCLC